MQINLSEEEVHVLKEALDDYVSDLREEIVKTEKYEWRTAMHREEAVLDEIKKKLNS